MRWRLSERLLLRCFRAATRSSSGRLGFGLDQGHRHDDRLALSRNAVSEFLKVGDLENRQGPGIDWNHAIYLRADSVVTMLVEKTCRHTWTSVVSDFPLRVVIDTYIAKSRAEGATDTSFE